MGCLCYIITGLIGKSITINTSENDYGRNKNPPLN
ncbi:Hypothetical Protein SLY_0767 [Strawberry lethal yellows phytoplasma (CPA) str. NZSb11]|uniref:Uncharacterized protein n=1 Tax=Strawberry lethal yellows phytoplasma (CPA) str. NZSb11 TaxID=980422 RepID=R4RXP8_PHYAS|nr:Hypothetical Protein SLY_0767 [Strawberry lethal yellows phytoplasma (CPA) str. NZSb11]